MKTVPFSSILSGVCQLVGLDRATLNDKGFYAIRDFTSKRINTIWDREEWPDIDRYFDTHPGNPISSIEIPEELLGTQSDDPICTEDLVDLLVTAETTPLRMELDIYFPRIYLEDFSSDAFAKGTVGSTYTKFLNAIYLTNPDETKFSLSDEQYNFTYESMTDEVGEFISAITVRLSTPATFSAYTYRGVNDLTTMKVVFVDNPQFMIQLPDDGLQVIDVYNTDSRRSTRAVPEDFLVEDESSIPLLINYPTETFSGPNNTELSYVRFKNAERKYLRYRLKSFDLTGKGYSTSDVYRYNSQVYFDWEQQNGAYNPTNFAYGSSGDFWRFSLSSGVTFPAGTMNPRTPTTYGLTVWRKFDIPNRFRDYLINGAAADFLRSEGRAEEAVVCDQLAEAAIQQQIDVLIRQQGQTQKMNMVYTY
ncbi:hypothetical protein UFOVP742_6 [uncultured Caudovirales phage]|uniref:Uncharacterized protein n=1 Tax=uncultured Caudovirales phage TaxID=2100421 RepID=A0A6J7X2W1_9CAUD|nr:hypothetical protein UFOVP742_6 [uncultured Caudovirales phage]